MASCHGETRSLDNRLLRTGFCRQGVVTLFFDFRHFRAPVRLPENVVVDVVIVTKAEGRLQHRVIAEELTAQYDDLGLKQERDAFDTLFDHAPDKLQGRKIYTATP